MVTWIKQFRKRSDVQTGEAQSNSRKYLTSALIRWAVNGTALCAVHYYQFHVSEKKSIAIGIVVGAFSALLQYQQDWFKQFNETDRVATLYANRSPQLNPIIAAGLRWPERFARWFFWEVVYVIFSEIVRAAFGIDLIGSIGLTTYLTIRLQGAIHSTVSQGAFELTVNFWRDVLVRRIYCNQEQADNRKQWLFVLGSVTSVSSLAASFSPTPAPGRAGFVVLVLGAIYFGFRGGSLNRR